MFTQEEINKLPKWAQNRLNNIEKDIQYWKDKAMEVSGEKETNVYIDHYPPNQTQNLPADSRITFKLEDGEINIQHKDNSLEIHSNSYNKSLAITPSVTNVVYCKLI